METTIKTIRTKHKLSLRAVEQLTGVPKNVINRVELGLQVPSKEHARALFLFFRKKGKITLGEVYDPTFNQEQAK